MKGKVLTITVFATIDAFFAGFALGFNSRHALVEDVNLKPVPVERKIEQKAPAPVVKDDKAGAKDKAGKGAKDAKAGKKKAGKDKSASSKKKAAASKSTAKKSDAKKKP